MSEVSWPWQEEPLLQGASQRAAPARPLSPEPWSRSGVGLGSTGHNALGGPQRPALDALAGLAELRQGAAQMTAQNRSWWPVSHGQVLDDAASLQSCIDPDQLEEEVCDLLGRHWRDLYEEHHAGLVAPEWLEGLLHAADRRAGDRGVRRLVYGVALIAAPGLADLALDVMRHASVGSDDGEPAWLGVPPAVTASPDLLLLRDTYGLRFGLLAQVTGPGALQRTYLFDVDPCHGFHQVLGSGYHSGTATATAVWRGLVGPSAAAAEPEPVPDDLLAHVLPGDGMFDVLFGRPVSDSHFTELFRSDGIVSAIVKALGAAGRPYTRPVGDPGRAIVLADSLSEQFKAWAARHHVDVPASTGPDDDIVTWLLHDWVSSDMPEALAVACSPHRIAAFPAYLNDDWQEAHRMHALTVLQPWARFCLDRTGIGGEAAEEVLAWAGRAADDPVSVGADLGDYLNRPIDETTVTGPAAR
ncbi:MAG: hypothetical protein L0H79_08585 [Intrasporangium sp.]|uniref:hypothetical protein n=1 Tax=Intrasporangium sp. TaxID=1925024 RepID=UPI0026484751|nr:hypothetical protein [Intrasporangium sp.]MDN5795792.1 hypothetical protein [Intrasporangium sp.]